MTFMSRYHSLYRLGACLCGVAVFALATPGCQTYRPDTSPNFPEASSSPVVLQPGDQLQILYTYWDDMNIAQTIRPDGKIALAMVGEVDAAGKTPLELRDALHVAYADKIKDPDITVVVEGLGNQRVFVAGEVMAPQMVPIVGRLTLLEAIMMAGGYNKSTAKLTHVVLVRNENGTQFSRTYDLTEAFKESESQSILLQPYDVVYVPRTGIDKVNQFVDQYINNIIPRNFQPTYVWSRQVGAQDVNTRTYNVNLPSIL
jgi:protein involved in polysaccharide export with SLBB domain